MNFKIRIYILLVVLSATLTQTACNSTRHIKDGDYLLKENSIKFESAKYLTGKNELTDRLEGAIAQQPNSSFIFDWFKPKLFLYNLRYEKYQKDASNYQLESRSVEPPVIYDSTTIPQSVRYMESILFHKGYFYAVVDDTTAFNEKKKKATVTYEINTGINYLIKKVYFNDIPDSTIKSFVREAFNETFLRTGKPYSAELVDEERSRITSIIRDKGYFYFAKDNISFELDTTNKEYIKLDESLIGDAADIVSFKKEETRPTLDVHIKISDNEEGNAFKRCAVNKIFVYPDFIDKDDVNDKKMISKQINNTSFRYHDYYLREKVIHNHIFVTSKAYYAQSDYDKTINELNQLGVFESVRAQYFEDTTRREDITWLNCVILLSPAKKYDFSTSWEASTGTTYTLGTGLTINMYDKNVAKGANLLTVSLNGGVETQIDSNEKFLLLTKTGGINTSIQFPKFLFPISKERYSIRNSPRTEVAVGANILDRINFFTLINVTSKFSYKWRETKTKNWEVSPFFINNISMPAIDPLFKQRLDTNDFLKNSYRETFIEGENITWIYNNAALAKWYDDYSYVRLSIEEAGGIVSGVNKIADSLVGNFSQYVKLDYDLRHFIKQKHAVTALRAYGGIGIPYGQSPTLPYLKQYFVGGPFSMRGWRIRTLGPGSFTNTNLSTAESRRSSASIDQTGDIKIELNGEYRFDIFKLFGGVLLFNGALFADAGNIWLSKPSESYPNGHFQLNRLYTDFAVSSGAGIRVDIASLFVFRFDLAIPLKIPGDLVIPEKEIKQGWIIEDIDPLYNRWRKDNIVVNIAIGYPF